MVCCDIFHLYQANCSLCALDIALWMHLDCHNVLIHDSAVLSCAWRTHGRHWFPYSDNTSDSWLTPAGTALCFFSPCRKPVMLVVYILLEAADRLLYVTRRKVQIWV